VELPQWSCHTSDGNGPGSMQNGLSYICGKDFISAGRQGAFLEIH